MAAQLFTRSTLLSRTQQALASLLARTVSSLSRPAVASRPLPQLPSLSVILLLRRLRLTASSVPRSFWTRVTSSLLRRDPSPNWSNRPPQQETGNLKRWLVVMEKPVGDPTRDEIIDKYIKTLAKIVGSEEEARMLIYFVSTSEEDGLLDSFSEEEASCFFVFGALLSEEDALKLKESEGVRRVLPDSYHGVKKKEDDDDDGGEPCSTGLAVPTYDPKDHEEWIRNNARVNERNRTYYVDMRLRYLENMQNNSNLLNAARRNQEPPNQGYQGGPPSSSSVRPNQTQFKLDSSSKLIESKLEHNYIRLNRLSGCQPGPGLSGRAPNQAYQGGRQTRASRAAPNSKLNESKFEHSTG